MSPTTAIELFEAGKSYYDNDNKPDEALKAFSEAVRLEPSNAEYHAWLARMLVIKERCAEALAPANQALQLNPRCQLAYRQRGAIHRHNKDYQEAIQDYSQAIQLDSQDYIAFFWRGKVYFALDDYENGLADIAQYYRLSSDWEIEEYSGQEAKLQAWYRTIHQHITKNLLPRLKVGDEKFVGYWPCLMTWGKRSEVRSHGGNAYTMTLLSYGSGYICLTNRNIYLFSFGQISQQFPLFDKGFLVNFLAVGFGNIKRQLEKTDQAWTVPYQTVSGAQISDQAIQLVTPAMTWEIYEHFSDQLRIILAGINLGTSGKYGTSEIASKSSVTAQPANTNVIDLLRQLGELKVQGIITEAEFEEKKKELLARL